MISPYAVTLKNVYFLKPFYSVPVLIATPSHNYTSGTMIRSIGASKIKTTVSPKNNAITTWIEVKRFLLMFFAVLYLSGGLIGSYKRK